jgi:aspartate/methionine/tyrosine aminotransferase
VKPRSGTTALLRLDMALPSREFCVQLLEATGVMLTPGSVMEMEGWLRMGYANHTRILIEGLDRLGSFMFRV